MQISVIIPNFNGAQFLAPCLTSLFESSLSGHTLEVIVVDNGSRDDSLRLAEQELARCRLLKNENNLGFTRAINQGAAAAHGDWLLLLNNDTELQPGSLQRLADHAANSDELLGGIQPLMVWAKHPKIIDSCGIALSRHFRARDRLNGVSVSVAPRQTTEIWGACGGCLLVRKSDFVLVGGFDPDFFAEFDDVDFALRMRWSGKRFELLPDAQVYHHRSPTSNRRSADKQFRHHRNQLWTGCKSLPRGMRWRYLFYRFQRDLFMLPGLLRKGRAGYTARSWREFIRLAPRMRERRKRLLKSAKLSDRDMREQLKHFMGSDG